MRRTPAAGTSSQYRFDSGLRADTFDTILRPYAALTDNPGTLFAEELIAAYPDAKIIVNKRSDIDAWHTSWKTALLPFCFDWHLWALSFFDRELFWMVAGWTYLTTKPYCVHSWDEQGRQVYQDHYSWIDVAIKRHGRAGTELCWEVHDGWEPLCNFLGRSIPEQPFPNGNGPEDFTRLINEQMHTAKQRAWRNVVLCLTTSIAISAYLVWST
ncbi:hypothetical protein KVT40_007544 [Elsinoe batatas]|uniref:Uncharacterized protein n=1 Tax=Elsinoe batatas TaxID=2601811 RepID=A0A8K0KVU8_9PEZI|nr:hypothetical protein KVT40_007544 [Elsinoe batatas]